MTDALADPAGPYQSLYRRYRPQRFADVLGQDQVIRPLRNAVRDGRVAHAYLFSGPRGTGKTSTARILAMALDCAAPVDGEPDGTCDSCRAIRSGSSLDVHELDAASNRRLEEMRELLARVSLGTAGRWKVYIVDEVHQLTPDAASALLKTLEEPPPNVVFVLATTDPQKVLPTIRSRTQHFEFRLLAPEVLEGLLRSVNERADLGVAPEAIDVVVRRGHGSARDALSVLDQVAAAGVVHDEVGPVAAVVAAVAERNPGAVLTTIAEASRSGRDPRRLAVDLLEYLRNGFLATQARSLVDLSDDGVAEVQAQANQLGLRGVVRALDVLGQALVDMRDAVEPRITLEAALVRLAAPDEDLAGRIDRLEEQIRALRDGAVPTPTPAGDGAPAQGPVEAPERDQAPRQAPEPTESEKPRQPPGRQAPTRPPTPGSSARRPPPLPDGPAPGAPRPPGRTLGAVRRAASAPPTSSAPSTGPARDAEDRHAPSRDELTKAWGDEILPTLPGLLRAYVASGRFVASEPADGVATLALADAGLLARAEPLQPQLEAALAGHFGRPVPVRLVVDGAAAPDSSDRQEERARPAEDTVDAPSAEEWASMSDAGPAVVSPEQRLLEAFPGAEEISP